jgi:hypothetical protein
MCRTTQIFGSKEGEYWPTCDNEFFPKKKSYRTTMKVLEIFAGTGSVKKVCDSLGWECVSVDITDKFHEVDYKVDILEWDYKQLAKDFDIIWASPPCATFSRLTSSWYGRKMKSINMEIFTKEHEAKREKEIGLVLLNKAKEIINYFQPKYYFIENPQSGRMKNYMAEYPHYDIDYCMFSDFGYRKRTRIWTNVTGFEALLCNKKCGNMIGNKHKHQIGCGGTQTTLKDRYRVPQRLIEELLLCCL